MKELTKKEINNVSGSGLGTILGVTALLYIVATESYGAYSGAFKYKSEKGITYNISHIPVSLALYPFGVPYRALKYISETIDDFKNGLKDGFRENFPKWQRHK